jgi:methylmalonyl-CoA mutase N-terminal domain/subunit
MVRAIEQGYPQREIQNSAYAYQLEIERNERLVVGQNAFTGDAPPVPILRIDPELEAEQIGRVRAVRARRDAILHVEALRAVARAASTEENLVPHILVAVKAYATVGEISDVLRAAWGEHVETNAF